MSTSDIAKQERCYYIDWLRVLGMLVVFLFHCARFFDSMFGWHVKNGQQHIGFDFFIAFCGGWMMPLFFLLSGGSTLYALKCRSSKQYIGERFKRLVIPYIMGILILIPPQRYMEALNEARFSGSYLDYYLRILKLDYFDHIDWSFGFLGYYGTHLWFIGLLFVLSVVALPLFLYLKRGTEQRFILSLSAVSERWGGIFLFAIPIILIHFIVHITFGRDTNWHGFCYYITIFIYGYILWSDKRFERAILKHRWVALATGILCFSIVMAWYAIGDAVEVVESRSYSLRALLFSTLFGMNTWSWLIFILSVGIKRLNFSSKTLGYCNEAVLPFYALHQTVILVIGFFVVKWNLNMMLKYPIVAVSSMILILAIYILLIRPINAVRFLFGMRLGKKRDVMQTRSSIIKPARKHFLSLILLISLFQISTIAFPQSSNSHSYLELTGAWKYRWGEYPVNEEGIHLWAIEETLGEEWKSITYGKSIFDPPGRNGERELWLCVSLPDTNWERPSVTVDNVSLPCDVYLEDKLIYKYEAVSLLGETKNRLPVSHMIPLETEYQNRRLFFRIYPEDASIMGIEGVLCGPQHELSRKIVKENIHLIILGCLFLATGLISILIFLKRRQEKIHLVFGLFSLCIGIMAIYEARQLRQLFFGPSSLADSIFIIVPFFMPGWLCMYFEYLFGSGYKSIIRRLWQIHLIYAILCLSILILNFAPFSALQMHQILFLIALITILVLFSTSVFYAIKGKPEARIITVGFAAFFVFGIYDILGGGLLLIPAWSGVTYPWGMLAFIFALGFVLERRFSEAHKQLQEYSRDLETKVAERTQDLNEKNETLEETLSELKSTQMQLVQAEKMASLGQLTAGVAHEINNPIGAINSNIALNDSCFERIKKVFGPISERKDLDEIGKLEQLVSILEKNNETSRAACDRIIEIVNSLKNFARLDESEYQKADIHEGIDSTLTLLGQRFRGKIEIIKDYGNIPLIKCFPNQLNQVFMNIISNAILAIEDEGSITIKTEVQNSDMRISIKDTGTGIPDEYKEKIFEPFFTTREIGEGRGLGLSLSFGIIEKHKGKIEFTSEVNKGSEFVISLPLQQ